MKFFNLLILLILFVSIATEAQTTGKFDRSEYISKIRKTGNKKTLRC